MNGYWNNIEKQISKTIGREVQFLHKEPASGGCINQSWKVTDNDSGQWFVKTNRPNLLDMFVAESSGLSEIRNSRSIQTTKSICYGKNSEFSYLVLDYIPLFPLSKQKNTGEQIARMHHCYSDNFGWYRDNTIGSTLQVNKQEDNWLMFWKSHRLKYQLELARKKAYPERAYEKGLILMDDMYKFFDGYQVKPSLLHGDLWGGNIASDKHGTPIIFDPAVYYGDREVDIAMTELFGGFNKEFYVAYNSHYALDAGYKTRKVLYNLYHILNHYNLFGGGYASQAEQMTDRLLSELK